MLLATLGVPFDPDGLAFALDAAVESGLPLVVANVVELAPLPLSVLLGYDQLDRPEVTRALSALTEQATSLGVEVERLRVRSPRPIAALLELVADVGPGILVFGPDRTCLRRRRYAKATKAIRESCGCLFWLPG